MKDEFLYYTSESLTKGHPDKLCDYISDCILDAFLKKDEYSKAVIETMILYNKIYITGQIISNAKNMNLEELVRNKIKEVGYDNIEYGLDYRSCQINIDLLKLNKDTQEKVNANLKYQVFGYACNETKQFMPYGAMLSHKIAERLDELRIKEILPYLMPKGQIQITMEYKNNKLYRISSIVVSTQYNSSRNLKDLQEKIFKYAILPNELIRNKLRKLNSGIILYMIEKLNKSNPKNIDNIRNGTNFIISCIYNAITEYYLDAELMYKNEYG